MAAKRETSKETEEQQNQEQSNEQTALDLNDQAEKRTEKANEPTKETKTASTASPQFYATLKRGQTFDIGGIVFKVDEEKEVTESLHSRLANNAFFSVRKE